MSSSADRPIIRINEIDGVRGWASLGVVFFHVFWEFFGYFPGMHNAVTAGILNGRFYVILFFILSGEALSSRFILESDINAVAGMAISRYFRLSLPIFAATLILYFSDKLNMIFSTQAAVVVQSLGWLGAFAGEPMKLSKVLTFSSYWVFLDVDRTSYLPFLWTMPIELNCSILTFLLILLYKRVRFILLILSIIGIIMVYEQSFTGCFLFGIILSDLRARGFYKYAQRFSKIYIIIPVIFLTYCVLAYCQLKSNNRVDLLSVAGIILLILIYSNASTRWFFGKLNLSQYLGKISFSLYLMHYMIIITFSSYVVTAYDTSYLSAHYYTILLIAALTVLISLGAAALFYNLERKLHLLAKTIAKFLLVNNEIHA